MLTVCQALWCTLGPDHAGVQELDTNSLILKSRIKTTRKLKYRVRECLGQLLRGGDTVRGEGARARRGKLVSYWTNTNERNRIKIIKF